MIRRLVVPTAEIGYITFILDSHEHVAVMTTLERRGEESLVILRAADDFAGTLDAILADLAGREGIRLRPAEEGTA